ncbi:acyltransferase [Roseospirillum parvum]|uniref:Transferase hexapeptide (Six repeat-containing protein) n=1 Tax=Roseospirillum parvum TaxID=83401 RepID=A0A1G8A2L3_9PROT|nr:acyltransferase [Roseospirillum parvum]SDH15174.1 transferase hexapeptide (six repeat-containing protein) [Roseospirillum parvum]
MEQLRFREMFLELIENQDNRFHPLVWINGTPEIGEGTYIGGMSEVNAKGARVKIGSWCDIASFVAINCADSHLLAIGVEGKATKRDIVIGDRVFVGSHCAILGGSVIGERSVIAAGTVLRGETVPPASLAIGNPAVIKPGYYKERLAAQGINL